MMIIEAPSNLGLIQLRPDREPGVRKLPEWLRMHGLYERIHAHEIVKTQAPVYRMDLDPETNIRNADSIAEYSNLLAEEVALALNEGKAPLVLGGDCSILIGCALGLKRQGEYGLFFIDGHTDFVTPEFSSTKAAAGMDLAIVTGSGHPKLSDISRLGPYIQERNALAFGNRYLEEDYVQLILKSSIPYYDLYAARKKNISTIAEAFLRQVQVNKLRGFWVHLDVDVLDNEWMPCVDSPQPGGLSFAELKILLSLLTRSEAYCGMDITILDPDLDPDGRYTLKFIDAIATIFV